jgi:hypothetical protein
MNNFFQFTVIIVTAITISQIAKAQSPDVPVITEAVDQDLYRSGTSSDDRLKDAMFGSNGETYQTHTRAGSGPTEIDIGASSIPIGTANSERVKCQAKNDAPCQ